MRILEGEWWAMPVLESKIQADIISRCKAQGWDALKFQSPSRAGEPDLEIRFTNGFVAYLEVKCPGRVPTKLQFLRIEELRRRGFEAYWVTSVDEAMTLLQSVERGCA